MIIQIFLFIIGLAIMIIGHDWLYVIIGLIFEGLGLFVIRQGLRNKKAMKKSESLGKILEGNVEVEKAEGSIENTSHTSEVYHSIIPNNPSASKPSDEIKEKMKLKINELETRLKILNEVKRDLGLNGEVVSNSTISDGEIKKKARGRPFKKKEEITSVADTEK